MLERGTREEKLVHLFIYTEKQAQKSDVLNEEAEQDQTHHSHLPRRWTAIRSPVLGWRDSVAFLRAVFPIGQPSPKSRPLSVLPPAPPPPLLVRRERREVSQLNGTILVV